ncbi:MFS general substrate transporter [Cyberlindnera jadinii NRRL Y-1542]|uniref:MFS general substrate transporter n=1 Tax=Cyberlindnera jadinii (strain ATCC 18201 / CBS 1600 / BCRC 20928 / JCM 3617 / NBRC 0987 / NRRL Y-1542) TaxID=983966 RepID=A0A1E4S593_CYBJN|nr:MFS general substrate transporter [Cyberlindnera jadinii NRRL Y-1542]ODV74623.1 MFS general substrate transporter [Cyberlindnera jadinii NRRL Y-1542]
MTGQTINYDAIPGNTNLVDLDGSMAARHSSGNKKIVLIPTPSDDPDDPLNWTPRRKWMSMFCVVVYTYGVGIPSAAIYSVLTNISAKTGISLGDLNSGTGYMFLFFGLGCMIFQPLALQYGKRPVYLFSVLATALVCIWSPYCKTNAEWIGSKILQGFVGAPIESLCEISVSDIFFEHERATGMSIYGLALLTSNYIAPVVAGFITNGMEWEWVMYFCSIWGAVAFIFLFLFMEETNYNRKVNPVKVLEAITSIDMVAESDMNVSSDNEKINPVLSNKTVEERLGNINENFDTSDEVEYPKTSSRTWVEKMSFTHGLKSKFLLPHYLLGPFKMLFFPSVLWAGFVYGSSLVWFNLLNATAGMILTAPPYNFSPSMVGLSYISPTIFSCVFFFLSGALSDWMKVFFAKRRPDGLSYPEDRLWILIIYMVLGFLASIGWGVGAYYEKHWMLLVISMGVLGGCGIFGVAAGVTYCSDSYHELDTEGMVVVIVIRNLMSFACSYGLTHWVTNMGLKNAFISSACILLFCNGTFLIMRYTGPYWRNKTKHLYWKFVEENRKILED